MPYKDPEKQREAQRRYEEKNRKGKQRTIWWAYLYEDSAPRTSSTSCAKAAWKVSQ